MFSAFNAARGLHDRIEATFVVVLPSLRLFAVVASVLSRFDFPPPLETALKRAPPPLGSVEVLGVDGAVLLPPNVLHGLQGLAPELGLHGSRALEVASKTRNGGAEALRILERLAELY